MFQINLPLIGREIARIKATQPNPEIMGRDWEIMLAKATKGEWQKTSVSLTDVIAGDVALEAKTLTVPNPHAFNITIAAIVGRINISHTIQTPEAACSEIVNEWNKRVEVMRGIAMHGEFVFLLKNSSMDKFAVRRFPVEKLNARNFRVAWQGKGKNRVLVGIQKGQTMFRWNNSGGQFTIYHRSGETAPDIVNVPAVKLLTTSEIINMALL